MKSAIAFALLGICAGVYDYSEHNITYHRDITLSGIPVIVARDAGKLGLRHGDDKILGYFGGGKPRVVGFGCTGHEPDAVLIGMEEDNLPTCERIEGITYAR